MIQKLKTIIVDDEEKAQRLTENLLKQYNNVEVLGVADGVDSAYKLVIKHNPDVVFLDVEMPGKNGFELVKMLQKTIYKPEIVFVTAFDKYAIEAFKHAAFNYLLKPIDKDELSQTILRLTEKKGAENLNEKFHSLINYLEPKNRIKLNTRVGYILIEPQDIIYCESDGSYTDIYLKNKTKQTSTFNLGKIEHLLPKNHFFRINRSVIIKLSYLKEVNRIKKTCSIQFESKEKVFEIPRKQLKELENYV